ncbi:BTAD domain-containing putative transcriptional regulator [Actinosynnema sp. NPDC004786]
MSVEFLLLGEIRARVDGVEVDLGHARQRCVLAALLVEPNRQQSLDVLVDRVWGDRPPRQARNTLYGYVYRLRQAFADVPGVAIDRTQAGYLLPVDEHAVDLHRFRGLLRRARGEEDRAALASVGGALGLWRGPALGGLRGEWAEAVRRTLEQERWQAVLHRNDLALRLGRHAEVMAELTALAEENPLDERLAAQVVVALHRSGRQADALHRYQVVRRRLAEELGADPGPELREAHQRVLAGEPTVREEERREAVPTPHELPAAPRLFVGRADQLARIDKALVPSGGASPVLAVVGPAGTGKTALVLHWAHRAVDRFPDGQLYADLRGFDPDGPPASPAVVMGRFLGALGVPPASVPAEVEAQAALYRSVVAGRRLLVVLDNARDTDQVLPLLPGSGTCTVLVTSRHRLTGLAAAHGVPTLELDVLPDPEARELLAGHVGAQRVHEAPAAVDALLEWCAGLPLAVAIVGAHAAAYPDFPLGALVAELREADGLAHAGDTELSMSLHAVFTSSYRVLPPPVARAFAVLGVAPGPDISLRAAAELLDQQPPAARRLLAHLETWHLLRQHVPGRYRMHDLVRLYAAERARDRADQEEALRRVVLHYARVGRAAEGVLYPYEHPPALGEPVPADGVFPDESSALAWLASEYACLIAAQELAARRGWDRVVWQLAWSLDTFQRRQGLVDDQVAVWRAAMAAADRTGDPDARALASWRLGAALARGVDLVEASGHLDRALALGGASGDLSGQANAHQALAWVHEQRGDDAAALDHATRALAMLRTLGVEMREAHALNQAGWYAAKLHDLPLARAHCTAALDLARRHGDLDARGRTLDSLGYIAHLAGDHDEAAAHYEQALADFQEVGATYDYADTLERLADSHAAANRHDQATAARRRAVSLFLAQHRTADADRVAALLGDLPGTLDT